MNIKLLAFCVVTLAGSLHAGFDEAKEISQAKQATATFGTALKAELIAAMQDGGPVNAIDVCNTRATAMAGSISLEQGMDLSRVSMKNRNPDNAPQNWQLAVLESFEARKQSGEGAGSLTWHEVTDTETGREFRFMQAIPTAGLCLQCHGATLAPAVADKLAELYPADQATGYSEGDIRGAFVVTRKSD